ncbi:MAG: hypothetical protein WC662_01215 [Candidatus Paceibacterota bacterium]|jgi:hypothetical protein
MQNKFFGSKLNSVLLLVLIILMIIAIGIMRKNKADYLGALGIKKEASVLSNVVKNESSTEWVSFKDSCGILCDYGVNVWYPKNYDFRCCGDTEVGSFGSLYMPGVEQPIVDIHDNFDFCFEYNESYGYPLSAYEYSDLMGYQKCTDPETYFQKTMKSNNNITMIEDITINNLGKSVLAYKLNKSENFIFKIREGGYYRVTFEDPNILNKDFINEFLNRLELWK